MSDNLPFGSDGPIRKIISKEPFIDKMFKIERFRVKLECGHTVFRRKRMFPKGTFIKCEKCPGTKDL
jgi:hypothetical protein